MDDHRELTDWLTLIHAPGLGASTFRRLTEFSLDPQVLCEAHPQQQRALGLSDRTLRALKQPDQHRIDAHLEWLQTADNHLLTLSSEDYPPRLSQIPDPPGWLFVKGDPAALWHPQVAIIGSREPSPGGQRNARQFSAAIARTGLVITSGLARGIDGLAHQACLDAGGKSVAVAATGLDRVYPAEHRALAESLVTQGAMVSEYPLGVEPRREYFPRRNRIISGLSLATLVVEAGMKSGSLITARAAMEQGREVYAIPGSIHNPMARGCHSLIKQGARLLESLDDLMDELASITRDYAAQMQSVLGQNQSVEHAATLEPTTNAPISGADPEYQALQSAIGFDPVTIDELVQTTGLTVAAVSSMLLMLELNDLIEAAPGGAYCRKEATV